jgi:hypothetical protein
MIISFKSLLIILQCFNTYFITEITVILVSVVDTSQKIVVYNSDCYQYQIILKVYSISSRVLDIMIKYCILPFQSIVHIMLFYVLFLNQCSLFYYCFWRCFVSPD